MIYSYFVSATMPNGGGRFHIIRTKPIANWQDILDIESVIKENNKGVNCDGFLITNYKLLSKRSQIITTIKEYLETK